MQESDEEEEEEYTPNTEPACSQGNIDDLFLTLRGAGTTMLVGFISKMLDDHAMRVHICANKDAPGSSMYGSPSLSQLNNVSIHCR